MSGNKKPAGAGSMSITSFFKPVAKFSSVSSSAPEQVPAPAPSPQSRTAAARAPHEFNSISSVTSSLPTSAVPIGMASRPAVSVEVASSTKFQVAETSSSDESPVNLGSLRRKFSMPGSVSVSMTAGEVAAQSVAVDDSAPARKPAESASACNRRQGAPKRARASSDSSSNESEFGEDEEGEEKDNEEDDDVGEDDDDEDSDISARASSRLHVSASGQKRIVLMSGSKRKSRGRGTSLAAATTVDGGDGGLEKKVGVLAAGQHMHNFLDWLVGSARKDKAGRLPSHPLFNPRTLFVPPSFLAKQTPASRQWWEFKAVNMDTLLFFKTGKFYEIFHVDADVVVRALEIQYMKGEVAHAGFPEISYGHFSERLVAQGFRVARVEQVETPAALAERNARAPKGAREHVVRRALCGIKSKGTQMHGFLDVAAGGAAAAAAATAAAARNNGGESDDGAGVPSYLFALAERSVEAEICAAAAAAVDPLEFRCGSPPASSWPAASSSYANNSSGGKPCEARPGIVQLGVTIIEASSGSVTIAEFIDDRQRSRLRTLIARYPPAEFLYERVHAGAVAEAAANASATSPAARASPSPAPSYGLSACTLRILKYDAPGAVHTAMAAGEEFWSAARACDELLLVRMGVCISLDGAPVTDACASSPSTSRLRQLDYFVEDTEDAEEAAASYFGVATVTSSSPCTTPPATATTMSSSGLRPPLIPPGTAQLFGSDGRSRFFPIELLSCMRRSAADGHAVAIPAAVLTAAACQCEQARATGGADVPPAALSLAAFGASMSYLRRCLVDHAVLSMCRVSRYQHADGMGIAAVAGNAALNTDTSAAADDAAVPGEARARGEGDAGSPHLVLDGVTIVNLELLANSYNGSLAGTLLGLFEQHTASPAGRRRMRQWLCTPLLRAADIEERLVAVDALIPLLSGPVAAAQEAMKGLPDLERLLATIHDQGSKVVAADHPAAAAVMYEETVYCKRKVSSLLEALRAFHAVAAVRESFQEPDARAATAASPLLMRAMQVDFPDVRPLLAQFDRAFDARIARAAGAIIPTKGTDAAYDGALTALAAVRVRLDSYLAEQRAELRCAALVYFDAGKDRNQIEVPDAVAGLVPAWYTLKSQRKAAGKKPGVRRYWTADIEALNSELTAAEERRDAALKDALRRIFHRFDAHRAEWLAAARAVSLLDCLAALAHYSAVGDGGRMARPEIVPASAGAAAGSRVGGVASAAVEFAPTLRIEGGRHPCMVLTCVTGGGMAVPNDICLGGPAAACGGDVGGERRLPPGCALITGPNMGGKSTVLRQACLTVVLAQIGCYVPADRLILAPVDRIFTRVGASDRILAGQSTFYVELAETATILNLATRHSLVILDELGRGTSTFDGNAIAYAVTKYLVDIVRCRTLFATHYHTLTEDFSGHPGVAIGHMRCLVENERDETCSSSRERQLTQRGAGADVAEEDGGDGIPRVTFLFKFVAGACPKSYGLNVARLAHLPESVIRRAKQRSHDFESAVAESKTAQKAYALAFSAAGSAAADPTRNEAAIPIGGT